MKFEVSKKISKLLKYSAIIVFSFFAILFITPFFFAKPISEKIKVFANNHLEGELRFSGISLSFFNHFPKLTLTLNDFLLKGSPPFEKDTLLAADEIALGINISSIFGKTIQINRVFLDQAFINVQVTEQGQPNYNVYKTDSPEVHADKAAVDSSSTSLNIEQIKISGSRLIYNDRSLPMLIDVYGLYYNGKGDLSKSLFELHTKAHIDSLNFYYDGVPYVLSKAINADLITKINTSSLAFNFEKNNLKINKLPVDFVGLFEFLENGYKMDFKIKSENTGLKDLFSAMPPSYLGWMEKTKIRGEANMTANLAGSYIAETSEMPDLSLKLNIKDGYILHQNAPFPVENLLFNFETVLPGLNPDNLIVNIDSLFFNIEKDYFRSVIRTKGVSNPAIFARIDSEIDLEKWDKAFGISGFDFKGKFALHLNADGQLMYGPKPVGIRKDTVLLSIPKFRLQSSLKNGYFKYASVNEPVKNIGFDVDISCKDSIYQHIILGIKKINFEFLSNYLKGHLLTSGVDEINIDAGIESKINLADIQQIYPLDSITISGLLSVNMQSKGKYAPSRKLFPVTNTTINLKDGFVKTPFYPEPVENISLAAMVNAPSDQLKDLNVAVSPFSFDFAGKPFVFNAEFSEFDDLVYSVSANGTIDLGRIYKVFSLEGLDVNGSIVTNLQLKGKQSDALEGRYQLLDNKGSLGFNDILMRTELYPLPFILRSGILRFDKDKIWLEKFTAEYGKSSFTLNGFLGNIINYWFSEDGKLKGNFDFTSDALFVDELMAYHADSIPVDTMQTDTAINVASGVVMIPENLEISLKTSVKSVQFQGMNIRNVKGKAEIINGLILLKETGFELAGASVNMDATYSSIDPLNAFFDYHISAKEFDVQKAYQEIAIFREMASSAASAQGIISLDYKLKGKLDQNMMPILPAIEGGGVLTLEKVKVAGLKMFTEISRKTEKESLKNPDLSKVEIVTSIKNNVITLEPCKFRIAGFRPRISGQTTFDGKLNLKFRLGLPPLGIFSIPMSITGTQTNPKIRFGKGGTEELDKDMTYSDELPPDLLMKIRAAKEEDIEEAPPPTEEIKK